MARSKRKRRRSRRSNRRDASMPFGRKNYVYLSICVLLIVLGFAIMRIENAFQGFFSLYVAPLMLMAGYVGVIFAIMHDPQQSDESDGS